MLYSWGLLWKTFIEPVKLVTTIKIQIIFEFISNYSLLKNCIFKTNIPFFACFCFFKGLHGIFDTHYKLCYNKCLFFFSFGWATTKLFAARLQPKTFAVNLTAASTLPDGFHWNTGRQIALNLKIKHNSPVINTPVEAEVQRAEFATFPHHLHHRLVVKLRDVPQVQNSQVM